MVVSVLALAAPRGSAAEPPSTSLPARAAIPAPAPATQPATGPAASPRERLRVHWILDGSLTLVLGGSWGLTELLEGKLAPAACRWCDHDLNGLDHAGRSLRWHSHVSAADDLRKIAVYGVSPLVTLGPLLWAAFREGGVRQAATDTLIVAEAGTLAAALVNVVRYAAGRERPYIHDLPAAEASKVTDRYLSFYSGHASLAFALAVSSGTVASLRRYHLAPWIWAGGLAVATMIGYLRLAADRHYLSDVLTGAAVGSALGFGIPYLHYRLRW
jgi:hypothetical protein